MHRQVVHGRQSPPHQLPCGDLLVVGVHFGQRHERDLRVHPTSTQLLGKPPSAETPVRPGGRYQCPGERSIVDETHLDETVEHRIRRFRINAAATQDGCQFRTASRPGFKLVQTDLPGSGGRADIWVRTRSSTTIHRGAGIAVTR